MPKMKAESMTGRLESQNGQLSFRQGDTIRPNEDLDSTLARDFCEYVEGRKEDLPSFDSISKIEGRTNDNLISQGMGVEVRNIPEKGIVIDIEEPISSRKIRFDIISKDGHVAYKSPGQIDERYKLDLENDTKYDKSRIEKLVMHLDEYHQTKEKEANKEKTV